MSCESTAAELILGFSVGGITLRIAIQWLKTQLKLSGMMAQLFTLALCFGASALYILIFKGDWSCLLQYGPAVYIGTQVAHQAVKK